MKQLLQTLLFFIIVSPSVISQTVIEWNGDGDGTSWDDPDNWDLDVVPNNTHRAEISSGALINISGSQKVDVLFIDNATTTVQVLVGASLTIDTDNNSRFELKRGIFKNFGDLNIVRFFTEFNIQSFFTNEAGGTVTLIQNGNNGNDHRFEVQLKGICTNNGTMDFEGTSDAFDLLFNDGTFINNGIINLSGTFKRALANFANGDFTNNAGAELNASRSNIDGINSSILWNTHDMENHGEITVEHPTDPNGTMTGIGLNILIDDYFENTGTISISNMTNFAIWFNTDWDNTGDIILGSTNAKLIGNSDGFERELNNNGGLIKGSGAISVWDGIVNGTLEIGDSPGEVNFQASQDFTNMYTPLEIAGTAGAGDPNGHDHILGERFSNFFPLVDIELGNTDIDFYLLGGFQPVEGDEFLIVKTDGQLTGSYGIIGFPTLTDPNLYWEIDYDYTNEEVWLIVKAFVVPVEMVSFNVNNREGIHELSWTTASEINSSHFEIQTSNDSENWKPIGKVQSQGNSSEFINYNFETSADVNQTQFYYRLKIIDLDGSYKYSEIRSVRQNSFLIQSAFPNPFKDQLEIKSAAGFSIHNNTGEMIYESYEQQAVIDFQNHPSGVYYILYKDETRKTEKLIRF